MIREKTDPKILAEAIERSLNYTKPDIHQITSDLRQQTFGYEELVTQIDKATETGDEPTIIRAAQIMEGLTNSPQFIDPVSGNNTFTLNGLDYIAMVYYLYTGQGEEATRTITLQQRDFLKRITAHRTEKMALAELTTAELRDCISGPGVQILNDVLERDPEISIAEIYGQGSRLIGILEQLAINTPKTKAILNSAITTLIRTKYGKDLKELKIEMARTLEANLAELEPQDEFEQREYHHAFGHDFGAIEKRRPEMIDIKPDVVIDELIPKIAIAQVEPSEDAVSLSDQLLAVGLQEAGLQLFTAIDTAYSNSITDKVELAKRIANLVSIVVQGVEQQLISKEAAEKSILFWSRMVFKIPEGSLTIPSAEHLLAVTESIITAIKQERPVELVSIGCPGYFEEKVEGIGKSWTRSTLKSLTDGIHTSNKKVLNLLPAIMNTLREIELPYNTHILIANLEATDERCHAVGETRATFYQKISGTLLNIEAELGAALTGERTVTQTGNLLDIVYSGGIHLGTCVGIVTDYDCNFLTSAEAPFAEIWNRFETDHDYRKAVYNLLRMRTPYYLGAFPHINDLPEDEKEKELLKVLIMQGAGEYARTTELIAQRYPGCIFVQGDSPGMWLFSTIKSLLFAKHPQLGYQGGE